MIRKKGQKIREFILVPGSELLEKELKNKVIACQFNNKIREISV